MSRSIDFQPARTMTPTTSADDIAAMFDLPPPTDEPPAESTLEDEEAALAAELAAAIESGDFADDAPESRSNLRVDVSWRARMRLESGHLVELEVRNISEGGVGLTSGQPLPAYTVVEFEMDVPPLAAGGAATRIAGTIKTTYTVASGSQILCGATWQAPPKGLDLVSGWIKRLQR
jgi:hypothetical protein